MCEHVCIYIHTLFVRQFLLTTIMQSKYALAYKISSKVRPNALQFIYLTKQHCDLKFIIGVPLTIRMNWCPLEYLKHTQSYLSFWMLGSFHLKNQLNFFVPISHIPWHVIEKKNKESNSKKNYWLARVLHYCKRSRVKAQNIFKNERKYSHLVLLHS